MKGPGEVGKIIVATANSGCGNGNALLDLLLCLCTADQIDGIDDGASGIDLKFPGQMEFADPNVAGNVIQRDVLCHMLADIVDSFLHIFTAVGSGVDRLWTSVLPAQGPY